MIGVAIVGLGWWGKTLLGDRKYAPEGPVEILRKGPLQRGRPGMGSLLNGSALCVIGPAADALPRLHSPSGTL
jgi:hypothetical protein